MRMNTNCLKQKDQIIRQYKYDENYLNSLKLQLEQLLKDSDSISFMENQHACPVAIVQLLPNNLLLVAESSFPHPSQLIPFQYNLNDYRIKKKMPTKVERRIVSQKIGVPNSKFSFYINSSCVTLSKSLVLSGSQFHHL